MPRQKRRGLVALAVYLKNSPLKRENCYPGRAQAEKLLRKNWCGLRSFPEEEKNFLIPVSCELQNSGSPLEAYRRLAAEHREFSFLLESAQPAHDLCPNPKTCRYSFIGVEPFLIFTSKGEQIEIVGRQIRTGFDFSRCSGKTRGNPVQALRRLLDQFVSIKTEELPGFTGGAVGYFGYDVRHFFEKLPRQAVDDLVLPDMTFVLVDTVVAFDHLNGTCRIISNLFLNGSTRIERAYQEAVERIARVTDRLKMAAGTGPGPRAGRKLPGARIESNMSRRKFEQMVRRAKEYIRAGDIYQANLSQRLSSRLTRNPLELYQILRGINPSPFAAYLDFGALKVASSSPERLLKVKNDEVETRPIAGTRPRGKSALDDRKLSRELILNEKERAEHIMLVDLERNDLGRVCRYGTVRVDELMVLEKYSHVIHIVSNVRGRLQEGKDRFDLLAAAFPGGTITGTPKIRCMEIIDELEPVTRNVYTGSIGYLGFNGEMDLNIVIRTFVIAGGRAYVQVGAGIVADSDPGREYKETLYKAEALLKALAA